MEFFTEYRPLFEFIYFLSGPLMLVGIIVAIIQLMAYREETKNRFERETVVNSINILDSKLRSIFKLTGDLYDFEKFQNIPEYTGDVSSFHKLGVDCASECLIEFDKIDNADSYNAVIKLLNEMDTFSQYVCSGIVNEELCYRLEHSAFLSYVNSFKHYIAFLRESDNDASFKSLVDLYNLWSEKSSHDIAAKRAQEAAVESNSKSRPKPLEVIGQ